MTRIDNAPPPPGMAERRIISGLALDKRIALSRPRHDLSAKHVDAAPTR
jgi:hypothetical protein